MHFVFSLFSKSLGFLEGMVMLLVFLLLLFFYSPLAVGVQGVLLLSSHILWLQASCAHWVFITMYVPCAPPCWPPPRSLSCSVAWCPAYAGYHVSLKASWNIRGAEHTTFPPKPPFPLSSETVFAWWCSFELGNQTGLDLNCGSDTC